MAAFHHHESEKEAREKWGQTQAYREYEAKQYPDPAKEALAQGMDQLISEFAHCMQQGGPPDSAQAQSLVSKLQNYITQHYYHCTLQILAGLGQMYVADVRFQNNIDKHAAGTAVFIREAILTYCAHHT